MTPAQKVATDAMREAWAPEVVERMLRAKDGRQERALKALAKALREDPGDGGEHWECREFIRECGSYDGDLSDHYLLAAVCRLALAPVETPTGASTPQPQGETQVANVTNRSPSHACEGLREDCWCADLPGAGAG